jgi:peptidyl-prolyl cis-trans isomerase SurA
MDAPTKGFLILKVEERYEEGQAPFEEVKDQVQEKLAEPRMAPKLREYLTKLRQEAFLEIKDGYVDTGAAPGKDTRWHDVATLKPQTTTKEEVAAHAHGAPKKLLGFVPIPGTHQKLGGEVDTSTLGERKPAKEEAASSSPSGPQTAVAVDANGKPEKPAKVKAEAPPMPPIKQ